MTLPKMHQTEIHINVQTVKHLITTQFPQWRKLKLRIIHSAGTDNTLYRLGSAMVVRLPRLPKVSDNLRKESEWLPILASYLPVSIPKLLAAGNPTHKFPYHWSIYQWIKGTQLVVGKLKKPIPLSRDIANFINVLHSLKLPGGPLARRGQPLSTQDAQVQKSLKNLDNEIDAKHARKIWEKCLQAPSWDMAPVWVHGDLMPMNLLVSKGRLKAVIDFEEVGLGDPACDLIPAWNLFPSRLRGLFKEELNVDEATWLRGKGWALSMALIQLPYYKDTNIVMATNARFVIDEILTDKN